MDNTGFWMFSYVTRDNVEAMFRFTYRTVERYLKSKGIRLNRYQRERYRICLSVFIVKGIREDVTLADCIDEAIDAVKRVLSSEQYRYAMPHINGV